ncbi:MAG: tRNA pseudouridine(55) synthase TruB [Dehalococcoidia bacterium]|nr:tRNA pseudouridine(55) synthase TruB [Dehalococcoidia bacterium]
MPRIESTLAGFLNVNKPVGLTSHDVVARIRRWSGQKHTGHGGTLDPQANGVLPIALGPYTRLLEFIPEPKVYEADIILGVATDSYDAEGAVTGRCDPAGITLEAVACALPPFVGEAVMQRPPRFSALKRNGQRSYDLARAGDETELPERAVRMYSVEPLSSALPHIRLRVVCGKGTYVRSLAHDLGRVLGCGAHLSGLVRTHNGPFSIDTAVDLAELETGLTQDPQRYLLDAGAALPHWPSVRLGEDRQARVLQGLPLILTVADLWPPKDLSVCGVQIPPEKELCLAYGPSGRTLAILQRDAGGFSWRPQKVFPGT